MEYLNPGFKLPAQRLYIFIHCFEYLFTNNISYILI